MSRPCKWCNEETNNKDRVCAPCKRAKELDRRKQEVEEEECLSPYSCNSCDDSGFRHIGDDPLHEIFHYSKCSGCDLWYRDGLKDYIDDRDILICILDVLHEIKAQKEAS